MSYDPIDDLPEETAHMEPFEDVCEMEGHEFAGGRCVDCGFLDEDYDPTPATGGMTDRADLPSYPWAVAS